MYAIFCLWLVFEAGLLVKKDLSNLMFPSTSSIGTRLLGVDSETSDPQFNWIVNSDIKYRRVKNTTDN